MLTETRARTLWWHAGSIGSVRGIQKKRKLLSDQNTCLLERRYLSRLIRNS